MSQGNSCIFCKTLGSHRQERGTSVSPDGQTGEGLNGGLLLPPSSMPVNLIMEMCESRSLPRRSGWRRGRGSESWKAVTGLQRSQCTSLVTGLTFFFFFSDRGFGRGRPSGLLSASKIR